MTSIAQHAMIRATVAQTPFQEWFASLLQTQGWTLQETARRLGVSGTTPFHYKEGNMLPSTRMQRRLADLTGTSVDRLARIVRESKETRRASGPGGAGRA